jgi:transposase InsO family protein
MTDNGPCYKPCAFARACKRLKLKHIRTKPYTPKTDGKAERFIQTALTEWAYARPIHSGTEPCSSSHGPPAYSWPRRRSAPSSRARSLD